MRLEGRNFYSETFDSLNTLGNGRVEIKVGQVHGAFSRNLWNLVTPEAV